MCQLTSYGFKLGSNADMVRSNGRSISIKVTLDGEGAYNRYREVTLNSDKIATGEDFWTDPAKHVLYEEGDEDFLDWIRKEA